MPRPTGISAHVDAGRLWQRHMALARHGALPGGGVDRQALSAEEAGARAELIAWGRAIGLAPYTDAAANLFLRLEGREADLPPLLVGSHIDSQPTGGKFDGAFGVLAALEVAEGLRASGARLRRPLEIVAWMNEEGSRFAPGMMGSAAYTGARNLDDVLAVKDRAGMSVRDSAAALLARDDGVPQRALGRPAAYYLEAHIEQGPLLELAGTPVGIVSGIQGKRTFRVTIEGEENHAGTSPRSVRRDALVSATAVISALQAAIWDEADVTRFTIGMLNLAPNAPSVVPAKAEFSIDLRHPDAATLARLGNLLPQIVEETRGRCAARVRELLHDPPLAFPTDIQTALASAADRAGIAHMTLASGAGHDARYLHTFCPSGMIFIPCRGGVSHSEAEWCELEHVAAGARVLAEAVADLGDR